VIIEQAKGSLAERMRVTPDRAFIVLQAYSRNHDLALTRLAADVVSGTADMLSDSTARPGPRHAAETLAARHFLRPDPVHQHSGAAPAYLLCSHPLARSLHRQQAEIVNRNPASSPRTTAMQDALLDDHVAHKLLRHLRVGGGAPSPVIRCRGIDLMDLFVPGTGGGFRVEAAD
jgi:hypothetical protein